MRFKQYLLEDEKIKIFRALEIKLVDSNTNHIQTVNFIKDKYGIDTDVVSILKECNNNLKEIYKGKYKFGLCLKEGISPNNLKKISNKQLKQIKYEWLKTNDKFAKIQKVFEKHLQNL